MNDKSYNFNTGFIDGYELSIDELKHIKSCLKMGAPLKPKAGDCRTVRKFAIFPRRAVKAGWAWGRYTGIEEYMELHSLVPDCSVDLTHMEWVLMEVVE